MWITDNSGTETAFLGASGTSSTDAIGIYHNGAWRLQVDSSGRVMAPYQPAFSVFSSSYQIPPNQTMPYNNAPLNRGGHFNTSTYRFTAPVSGVYLFSVYDIGQNTGTSRFSLYKNGASTEESTTHQLRAANTTNYASATSFWLVSANINDYFSVWLYDTSTHGTAEYSWFSGYLVG